MSKHPTEKDSEYLSLPDSNFELGSKCKCGHPLSFEASAWHNKDGVHPVKSRGWYCEVCDGK